MTTPEFLSAMKQLGVDYDDLAAEVLLRGQTIFEQNSQIAQLKATIVGLDAQLFDLKAQLAAVTIPPIPVPLPTPGPVGVVELDIPFNQHFSAYGFVEQSKVPGRATMVTVGGRYGVRLHTEPGDNNVANSGTSERDDLYLATPGGSPVTYTEGMEQWWWHSIFLPDDFTLPKLYQDNPALFWHMYVLFDFHHTGPTGQANFHVLNDNGVMSFVGHGGVQDGGTYKAPIGPFVKNVWLDFVYHVRWSATNGFFDAWVNGVRKLSHVGPTLYPGMGCYLKPANYHVPVCDPYPACVGTHSASSVIHGPIKEATTIEALGWKPVDTAWQTIVRV